MSPQHPKPPIDILLEWISIENIVSYYHWNTIKNITDLAGVINKDGLNYCILKGHGNSLLYNNLKVLRQSGDIDVWIDGGLEQLLNWASQYGHINSINDHHFNLELFKNQSVEVHYKAGNLINRWRNKFYQQWLKSKANCQFHNSVFLDNENKINIPTLEFNQVFLLAHLHEHFFCEGVGLRHVMDYFFLLKKCNEEHVSFEYSKEIIEKLGLTKFAEAIMWVIKYVFHYDINLPWEPNKQKGSFVLKDVMRGGNFGQHDTANLRSVGSSHIIRFLQWTRSSCRYLKYFPKESMWSILDFMSLVSNKKLDELKINQIVLQKGDNVVL